jgi:GMP synthase (glutamine-hydrolysing)
MHHPILIVLHQENSTPGRVGHALRQRGFPLDIRRPRYGDPLPATMVGHAGAIIFGGPMSANDADDFIGREIDWIALPLKEQKPFLGICLGAQMLARQLGSRVFPHADGHAEIGYYPIRPTETGRTVCDPWPEQVYQWHREGFDLPAGADLLAEGDTFPVQAFRYGGGYALQFHPDVTTPPSAAGPPVAMNARCCPAPSRARRISPTAPPTIRRGAPGSPRFSITGWDYRRINRGY